MTGLVFTVGLFHSLLLTGFCRRYQWRKVKDARRCKEAARCLDRFKANRTIFCFEGPTARNIPAQANGLGKGEGESGSAEGAGHKRPMNRPFRPSCDRLPVTQSVALGWYVSGPLALFDPLFDPNSKLVRSAAVSKETIQNNRFTTKQPLNLAPFLLAG